MMESNLVGSPIVPSFKIGRDQNGDFVDETYYKQLVGSLMYLTATRPNMMFVTCLISRYMAKPMEIHLQAAKRAFRYLKGTVNYEIHYNKGGDGELLAFTNSDYARDMEDTKSTFGYVFFFKKAVYCDFINHRSRVCGSYSLCLSRSLDEENFKGARTF